MMQRRVRSQNRNELMCARAAFECVVGRRPVKIHGPSGDQMCAHKFVPVCTHASTSVAGCARLFATVVGPILDIDKRTRV